MSTFPRGRPAGKRGRETSKEKNDPCDQVDRKAAFKTRLFVCKGHHCVQAAGIVNDSEMVTRFPLTVPVAPSPIPLAAKPRQIRHARVLLIPVGSTLASIPSR